jgi:hypothetical protein
MKTENVRNNMLATMLQNYERDGYLAPILFFIGDDDLHIALIPNDALSCREEKEHLCSAIKMLCANTSIECMGIIFEAFAKKIGKDDSIAELIMDGTLRISQLNEKQDIIIMIFSTPEKEEFISYLVDPKTKTVLGEYTNGSSFQNEGIFSNFFELRNQLS